MLRHIRFVLLLVLAAQFALWPGWAAETEKAATEAEEQAPVPEPDLPSVLKVLETTSGLGLFRNLIRLAGEPEIFSDGGPMTVFVPPDDVLIKEFNNYMAGAEGENYLKRLRKLVLSHVLREQYSQDDLRYNITITRGRQNVQTVSGDALTLRIREDRIVVSDERGNAVPVQKSIVAEDGVVHVLEGAMLKAR